MTRKFGVVVVAAMLLLAPQVVLGLAPGNPQIYLSVSPSAVEAEAGGSATVTVSVISQEGYEANTQMTLVDPPAGVTATFDPNPVDVPGYDMKTTVMTINVASTAAQGEVTLQIYAQCVEIPECADIDKTKEITLTISGQAANGGNGEDGVNGENGDDGVNGDGGVTTVTLTSTVSTIVTTTETTESVRTETATSMITITSEVTTGPPVDPTLSQAIQILIIVVAIAMIGAAVLSLRKS